MMLLGSRKKWVSAASSSPCFFARPRWRTATTAFGIWIWIRSARTGIWGSKCCKINFSEGLEFEKSQDCIASGDSLSIWEGKQTDKTDRQAEHFALSAEWSGVCLCLCEESECTFPPFVMLIDEIIKLLETVCVYKLQKLTNRNSLALMMLHLVCGYSGIYIDCINFPACKLHPKFGPTLRRCIHSDPPGITTFSQVLHLAFSLSLALCPP